MKGKGVIASFRSRTTDSFIKYEGGKKDNAASPEKPSEKKDEVTHEGDAGFTYCEGLKIVIKQSIPPIVGSLFHPSYMMVNALILGRITLPDYCKDKDYEVPEDSFECMGPEDYLSAFGIASSTIGIAILSTSFCYIAALNNVVPQAYGAGNFELVGSYLNRMLILASGIFIPILILLQFIYYPFRYILNL